MEKNSREGESNFLNFFVVKQKKKKKKKKTFMAIC